MDQNHLANMKLSTVKFQTNRALLSMAQLSSTDTPKIAKLSSTRQLRLKVTWVNQTTTHPKSYFSIGDYSAVTYGQEITEPKDK